MIYVTGTPCDGEGRFVSKRYQERTTAEFEHNGHARCLPDQPMDQSMPPAKPMGQYMPSDQLTDNYTSLRSVYGLIECYPLMLCYLGMSEHRKDLKNKRPKTIVNHSHECGALPAWRGAKSIMQNMDKKKIK